MRRSRLPLALPAGSLLVGALAACAAVAPASEPPAPAPAARPRALEAAYASESTDSSTAPRTEGAPEAPSSASSELGLSAQPAQAPSGSFGPALPIWSDPRFQQRFAEGFLSETEIEPRVGAEELEQMLEVQKLLGDEKFDKAIALLEKQRAGHSAVFDFTLGGLRFQREELPAAAEAFSAAVEKHPKFRRAWRALGLTHLRLGESRKAAEELSRTVELGGGDAITYGLLGITYLELGEDISAESALRMAILLDPLTFDFQLGLARSFFNQKRYPDAIALCESLIAAQPDKADLWLLQANAFVGLEQPTRAAQNLEMVDRLGKATPESLNMLGDIYVNEELFDLAVGAYERALERGLASSAQPSPERAVRAAKALAVRGASEPTRRLVERIEASFGERLDGAVRKDLLKLRARLAVAEGAGEEEARVLQEIVALDPLDGEALTLLGQHFGRAGDVEQAIFYFERAESLDDFRADAEVRHAQLLVGQGRYAEALPLLRSAQSLEPRDNVQQYLEQVERVAQGR